MKNGVNGTEECCQSVPPQGRQPQHGDGSGILQWSFDCESGFSRIRVRVPNIEYGQNIV